MVESAKGKEKAAPNLVGTPGFVERRATDLSSESTRTRLVVLEHKMAAFEDRLTDMEASLRFINMKLDDKAKIDAETLRIMEGRLSTVGTAVELMVNKLNETTDVASRARRIVDKHETIGATLVKIGGAITLLLTTVWAIFRYYVTF